jgi:hypothetical protein
MSKHYYSSITTSSLIITSSIWTWFFPSRTWLFPWLDLDMILSWTWLFPWLWSLLLKPQNENNSLVGLNSLKVL